MCMALHVTKYVNLHLDTIMNPTRPKFLTTTCWGKNTKGNVYVNESKSNGTRAVSFVVVSNWTGYIKYVPAE